MRSTQWVDALNLSVRPSESRPDAQSGEIVYRVRDIFTTRLGSWEPSNEFGALPQWARDAYLRPWGAPDYFDDAGGDHHLFARVLDQSGAPVKDHHLIRYWSDGFDKLGDAGYAGYVHMTPKQGSGWANTPIFNSYNPEAGQIGAWCWCPQGAADVVVGGGLPNNNHISTFVVWQAHARGEGGTPDEPSGPLPTDDAQIRAAIRALALPGTQDHAPFRAYARGQNLGAPVTGVTTVNGMQAQGYANGIVFAPLDRPDEIGHIKW